MVGKGVPTEVADGVLERFAEVGLVDDLGFARLWVEGQRRRMTSTRSLRQELHAKGVAADTIDEALGDRDVDADHEAALALARKKARSLGALEPHVRQRRLAGALARRGFPPGLCRRVVGEVLGELDADEGDGFGE